jgi:hypothetical protein
MKQIVTINLTTRTARDWQPPSLVFGESLTLALRLYKNSEGEEIEAGVTVTSLKSGIGEVDARPLGGQFKLKIGPGAATSTNTTSALTYDATLDVGKVADAINGAAAAADYGEARVVWCDDSWLIFFGDQTQEVPLTVIDNSLWPLSLGRVSAYTIAGKWVHELRLIQAPAAFASNMESLLPAEPVITRIQAGGSDPSGTFFWNEIQQLYFPPEFRGTIVIKLGYAKSAQLSREDDIEAIQKALQPLGEGCFKVTLPLPYRPTIEFVGDYARQPYDLLASVVTQAPAGDPTFTITLKHPALAAMLRRQKTVTLPLEIRLAGTDADGVDGDLCALVLPVTIKSPVVWPEIEEIPLRDLLRPYSPKTYVPHGVGNELTVGRAYGETVGDGDGVEFVVAHGLHTGAVLTFVTENGGDNRLLVNGTDYAVTIDNDDQVTVTALLDAPPTDGWRITVLSALAVAQWATDLTVTVPQVVAGSGYQALPDFMDSMAERIARIEALLSVPGAGAKTPTETPRSMGLVPLAEAMPPMIVRGPATAPIYQLPPLPRSIRDASVANITGDELADPTTQAGAVLKWNSTSEVYLPNSRRGRMVTPADAPAVLSDGYNWWLAADGSGGVTGPTFHPIEMDRTLWEVALTPEMLAPGRNLTVSFNLLLALLAQRPELRGVYTLRVRKGTMTSESGMAGANVEGIAWDQDEGAEELLFEQRLSLTRTLVVHPFSVQVSRDAEGALAATRTAYGKTLVVPAPQQTQFILRAELCRFDLENYTEPMGLPTGQVIAICGGGDAADKLMKQFNFEDKPTPLLAASIV